MSMRCAGSGRQRAEHGWCDTPWEEARRKMQSEHAVAGGLSEEQCQALFEAHARLHLQKVKEAEKDKWQEWGG